MVDETTAEEFSAYMKKFKDLYASLASLVKHHISSTNPVILDLGAGPGLLSKEINRLLPQATVIGIDPLRKMLRLAQENTAGKDWFTPLLGVSENIPLKNSSVDCIVSRFSLPYWEQPQQSFREMYRVLRPEGTVVFECLNKGFPAWKLWGIRLQMRLKKAGRDVTKYHADAYKLAHSLSQVEQFFTDAGFRILQKEGKKTEWRFILIAQKP